MKKALFEPVACSHRRIDEARRLCEQAKDLANDGRFRHAVDELQDAIGLLQEAQRILRGEPSL